MQQTGLCGHERVLRGERDAALDEEQVEQPLLDDEVSQLHVGGLRERREQLVLKSIISI